MVANLRGTPVCANPTPGVTVSCPSGSILVGITNGAANCLPSPAIADTVTVSCPSGISWNRNHERGGKLRCLASRDIHIEHHRCRAACLATLSKCYSVPSWFYDVSRSKGFQMECIHMAGELCSPLTFDEADAGYSDNNIRRYDSALYW